MIREYFKKVEEILSDCPLAIDIEFDFTVVDLDRGFWKGKVRFRDGSDLHLFEYVVITEGEPEIQDYRYHFQDRDENLVFRHDNAPHHSELETHPHHLHKPGELKPSQKPNLENTLDKAMQFVLE